MSVMYASAPIPKRRRLNHQQDRLEARELMLSLNGPFNALALDIPSSSSAARLRPVREMKRRLFERPLTTAVMILRLRVRLNIPTCLSICEFAFPPFQNPFKLPRELRPEYHEFCAEQGRAGSRLIDGLSAVDR